MPSFDVALRGFEHLSIEADNEEEALDIAMSKTKLPNVDGHEIEQHDEL